MKENEIEKRITKEFYTMKNSPLNNDRNDSTYPLVLGILLMIVLTFLQLKGMIE